MFPWFMCRWGLCLWETSSQKSSNSCQRPWFREQPQVYKCISKWSCWSHQLRKQKEVTKKHFTFSEHILLLISSNSLCNCNGKALKELIVCNDSIDPLLLCYFRTFLNDKLYERDLEAALTLSLLDSSRTQDGEPTTKTGECSAGVRVHFPHSWIAKLYVTVV